MSPPNGRQGGSYGKRPNLKPLPANERARYHPYGTFIIEQVFTESHGEEPNARSSPFQKIASIHRKKSGG
jgi:hypothetical protein